MILLAGISLTIRVGGAGPGADTHGLRTTGRPGTDFIGIFPPPGGPGTSLANHALRGACSLAAHALAALMAPDIALLAPAALGLPGGPACSANVAFGHEGSGQRNRRTDSTISTGRPPAAPSATTRAYPPWTREDTAPHAGHRACASRQRARITTASPVSSTRSTRSPPRCGNNMSSSSSPCPEISRTRPAAAAPADGMAD